MNTLGHYFSEEAFQKLQSATGIKIFDSGSLDIAFYQWLLGIAPRAEVQLLLFHSEAGLTPSYISRFNASGNLLLQLPANRSFTAPTFLLVGEILFVADAGAVAARAVFRQETHKALVEKYTEWFDRLLEIGRLASPGVGSPTPKAGSSSETSGAVPADNREIVISFRATPSSIESNRRVALSWEVKGADHVRIEPLIGPVPARGERLLSLEKSTLFTLSAHRGAEYLTSVVKVEVLSKPGILYFLRILDRNGGRELTLSPSPELPDHFAVIDGQELELSWQAIHSDTFYIDGEEAPLNGSRALHPEKHLELRLLAVGATQKTEKRVKIEVFPRPEITHLQLKEAAPVAIQTSVELNAPAPVLNIGSAPEMSEKPSSELLKAPVRPATLAQRAQEFCWFCAGVHRQIIRECPASESVKYAGIGLAVLFTGLLAALSGGYALYTAFDQPGLAAAFGLLWGALIFNIDRLVVASMKKDGPPARQWLQALPRFLLSILLSVVIAKPLELRVFKPEIDAVLTEKHLKQQQRTGSMFDLNVAGIDKRIAGIKAETDRLFDIREQLYQDYRCECDGTCGTGKRGRGSECERKEQKYRQADAEYQALKTENDQLIAQLRAESETVNGNKQTALTKLNAARSDGLLARLDASGQLPFLPGFFIMLLILMVEIAPVLSKLLTPRGVYDHAVRLAEERFSMEQEALHTQAQEKLKQQSELKVQLEQAELSRQIDQKAAVLRLVADAQLMLVKEQVDDWVRKEREKRKEETK